jgi:hypothetical protein
MQAAAAIHGCTVIDPEFDLVARCDGLDGHDIAACPAAELFPLAHGIDLLSWLDRWKRVITVVRLLSHRGHRRLRQHRRLIAPDLHSGGAAT